MYRVQTACHQRRYAMVSEKNVKWNMCILVGIIFAFQIPSVVKSPSDQYGKKGGRTAPTAGAVGKFSEAVQGYLGYTILYTFSWLKSISLLLINPMVKFIAPYIYW